MIRLNVFFLIEKSENCVPLVKAATELVSMSLRDKGCIDYDLFASATNDDRMMIVETWRSEDDLKDHMESEHFKRIVPQLQQLATMTFERFDF